MKIAYQHILNYLVEKPSIHDLSQRLIQLGHENEIEDSILDIEFTPNRGDCLSLLGLTRDLNVYYKTKNEIKIYEKEIQPLKLNFNNSAQGYCNDLSFLNIEIQGSVNKDLYKPYLNNYFKDLRLNKNNFFTDVSNYIAYEMGQPTHCYDFSKIQGDISLEYNNEAYEFETLLGKNITLKDSNLVFLNNNRLINLAGVVGGAETACSIDTKNVLIECAHFLPESIIGKSVKYDLHSDAAHKFERGVDPKCHEKVLRRFIQIVSDHSEITKLELSSYSYNNEFKPIKLDIDIKKINNILGTDISKEYYIDSLKRLGFIINKHITVPSFRSDISHQNDLAEEVARVIGYNNIKPQPIKSIRTNEIRNENKIKYFLIDNGFSEVINSPFCGKKTKCSIKVDNPLDINRKYLRTNLKDSLIDNLIYNEKRQKDSLKFFEISDIYYRDSNNVSSHKKMVAIIVSGRQGHNHQEFSKKLDRKYLVSLFKEIEIDIDDEIHEIDRNKIDSKIKSPIYSIEVDFKELNNKILKYKTIDKITNDFIQYSKISDFPTSQRDFSFSVDDPSQINNLISTIELSNSSFLKNFFMFDFYIDQKTKITKIGYRFIFQSKEKTLTDEEVNLSVNEIIKPILMLDSVNIPSKN